MSVFLSLVLSVRKGLLVLVMLLYSGCMIAAARQDLKSRRISKKVSCILLSCSLIVRLLGLLSAHGTDALLPGLIEGLWGSFMLFLLIELVNLLTHFKGIGGGDIRLILAGGFVLGPEMGLYALFVSLILAVIVTGIIYVRESFHVRESFYVRKSFPLVYRGDFRSKKIPFRSMKIPLGPYLAAGFLSFMWLDVVILNDFHLF